MGDKMSHQENDKHNEMVKESKEENLYLCDRCEKNEQYIEFGDEYICLDCYTGFYDAAESLIGGR